MGEVSPFRTRSWIQRLGSNSDHNLSGQSDRTITRASQPSLDQPSQPASNRESRVSLRRIFKSRSPRSARSAGLSLEPTTSGSSAPGHSSDNPNQDPSPHTVLAYHTNTLQDTNSGAAKAEPPDPKVAIEDANIVIAGIKNFSGVARNTPLVTSEPQSILDTVDTFSPIIAPLKVFNSVANTMTDIPPYTKTVLSMLTGASKLILDQQDQDNAVHDLLKKLSEVYAFMTEDGRLAEIATMQELYGKLARQTLECADFIVHYFETKSAWRRLAKNVFKETGTLIKSYSDVFDTLMQQFRDEAVRDIVVNVYHFAEDMDFNDMIYAEGARRHTSKRCLPGTREDILTEIKTWIDSTGEDVERVFWLNGTAGKGKSAIAHTIADWFIERGGPGTFFCFDRTREADRRHEKIFTTIARDLADGDPVIRRALASVIRDQNELRHTTDVMRQWRELILGPVHAAAKVDIAPVLIVIDALNESGDERSREQILRVLAGKQGTISPNLRVLITSRPLPDIDRYLRGAPHVRHVSMDDAVHVSIKSSEHDIQHYVSTRLKAVKGFTDEDFERLAVKSDGLFEWARLACDYISDTEMVGQDSQERFEAVLAETSEKGTYLLDEMYRRILEDLIREDEQRQEAIKMFCSVMGQVCASLEPLPCTALTAMRQHFPLASDRYPVEDVIRPLGLLVTGTTDSQIPVRPLHASLYDFLTDKSRSNSFFVDVSSAQRNLAFASLGILKQQLHFNICSLGSSYLPNSAIPDLGDRVKECISAELSYSCRFWGTHVGTLSVEPLLVEKVRMFFDDERLLFWLEVVSLLKLVGDSVTTLSGIADWLTNYYEYTDIVDAVRDTRRFLRTFAPAILRSTPHLYLSALPFAPIKSTIFDKFAKKFPCTPGVVAGHVEHWPSMEKTIFMYCRVYAIAISPDGSRFVCGLEDGTIYIRDMDTGEVLGAPLLGHTGCIWSIAVSPNGCHIVSGSADGTVRVWDAGTGEELYRLQGHTDDVFSVAISPNSNRIVSGSGDGTIRVWDIETGEALGTPLEGHIGSVTSVAISPWGDRIVSGSKDNTLRIWDMVTGKALGVPLRGHTDSVESVAISPDGYHIASGSFDRTIRMWDATTGVEFGTPLLGHTDSIYAVTISPDGNSIVSGSGDNIIRVWDTQTGEALGMLLQGPPVSVSCVAVSPDGTRIVSCSDTVRVWDAHTIRVRDADAGILSRHTDKILCVAISPDGNHIVSSSRDNTIRVWDMSTGKASYTPLQGHTSPIWSVAVSQNHIVSGSSDNTIRVWDATTGKALGLPFQGHTHIVRSVTISLDGTRIISGSADCMIRVWDITGKPLVGPLQGHTFWVESVAISCDGNLIVSGSFDKTIRMWDAMTGEALGPPLQGHTGRVMSVAISPDGKRIVSGSTDETIRVWDVRTGKASVIPLQGHTDVLSVAISPNGNLIVSGSSDKTIRVWDAITAKALGEPLRGHTDQVQSVAISPDGKRIVSCSDDVTIRVWDLESFTQLQSSKSPAILLSSDARHALCSPPSFLQASIPLVPNEEGWIVGPDGQLLLWVPASLYPVVHVPKLLLVISNDVLQVDLSHFAHGESWRNCRRHEDVSL